MRLRGSFKTSYRVVYFTRFWERGWESICQNPLLLQLSSPGLYKRVFTRVIFSLVSWLPLTFWTQKNRDRERERGRSDPVLEREILVSREGKLFGLVGLAVCLGEVLHERRIKDGFQVKDEVGWPCWPCALCFLYIHPFAPC